MKLFLFHHAGGDKYAFRNIEPLLLPKIECVAIEIPGRGDRFGEPLIDNIKEVVEDVFNQIKNNLQQPYAFVGLSMGALVAYLLTIKIKTEKLPQPHHLFLVSRRCPYSYSDYQKIAHLSSDEFWEGIMAYGGCPQAIIDHPELKEIFEPILRADFQLLESYSPDINPEKIEVKATVLYGEKDRISHEQALSWNKLFELEAEVISFDGGHFFMLEEPELAINIIKSTLDAYT